MANKNLSLKNVPTTKLVKGLEPPKGIKVTFDKKSISKSKFKQSLTNWKSDKKIPKAKAQKIPLKTVKFTKSNLDKFVKVRADKSATAALDKHYKQNLSDFVSISHSSQMILAYSSMKDEFKTRMKKARTPMEKDKLKKQWKKIVNAAVLANKVSYGTNINESKLNKMSSTFKSNKTAMKETVKLVKSIKTTGRSFTLANSTLINAELIPAVDATESAVDSVIEVVENLCDSPISGSLTKHYSNSFNISVSYRYWCPTWRHPTRMCTGRVTLAGVSINMGIDVFYNVTCCGAVVGGSAFVNACGTIIGITKCAGCRANVVAVGGIGNSPLSNNTCQYGLGAKADIRCTVGGYTVFYAAYNFGLVLEGACPPSPLPC